MNPPTSLIATRQIFSSYCCSRGFHCGLCRDEETMKKEMAALAEKDPEFCRSGLAKFAVTWFVFQDYRYSSIRKPVKKVHLVRISSLLYNDPRREGHHIFETNSVIKQKKQF